MIGKYLIAFSGKPHESFLGTLRTLAQQDGAELKGAILTDGPGCRNLAFIVECEKPERFAEALTMALMPAKYETCEDKRLVEGQFLNELDDQNGLR